MQRVSEKEYKAFKEEHDVENTCMCVTESFPDGSYSRVYKLGTNRRVNMCAVIHTATFNNRPVPDEIATCFYIF